jgi:hypothetical protein
MFDNSIGGFSALAVHTEPTADRLSTRWSVIAGGPTGDKGESAAENVGWPIQALFWLEWGSACRLGSYRAYRSFGAYFLKRWGGPASVAAHFLVSHRSPSEEVMEEETGEPEESGEEPN